ncbi:MAG: hypothetical protein ABW135_08390 [Thermoleophilaceae bacterium]
MAAVTAWAKPNESHGHKGHKTITVIEHATTDTTTDTQEPRATARETS